HLVQIEDSDESYVQQFPGLRLGCDRLGERQFISMGGAGVRSRPSTRLVRDELEREAEIAPLEATVYEVLLRFHILPQRVERRALLGRRGLSVVNKMDEHLVDDGLSLVQPVTQLRKEAVLEHPEPGRRCAPSPLGLTVSVVPSTLGVVPTTGTGTDRYCGGSHRRGR